MIYYSHVNEDNRAEKQVMDNDNYQTLVAVAGSGERVISLMEHPSLNNVHAIDINIEALYLLELKIVALSKLEIPEYLEFIGYASGSKNLDELYKEIRGHLSKSCLRFWDNHPEYIEKGLLHMGHFESFLNRIRPILSLVLGSQFYKVFNHKDYSLTSFTKMRWDGLKILFSKGWAYYLFGLRDKAFITPGVKLSRIPEALQKSMNEKTLSNSCMAHLIFFGSFGRMNQNYLPPSLDKAVLQEVKDKLSREKIKIQYHHMDCLDAIKTFDPQASCNSFYSLSDIMSFEELEYLLTMLRFLTKTCDQDRFTMIARSFVRNRIDEKSIIEIEKEKLSVTDISGLDKTNMYQLLQIDKHVS